MIKLFVLLGVGGVLVVGYLTTFGVAPEAQLPPTVSQLVKFEAEGYVPGANDLVENPEVGHGVFDVPEEDEEQLKIAMENMDMDMAGMDMAAGESMEGMDMSGSAAEGDSMAGMDMSGTETEGDSMAGMNMSSTEGATMDMDMDGDGVMDMSSSDMAGMTTGSMDMSSTEMAAMTTSGMDMSGSETEGNSMAGMNMSSTEAEGEEEHPEEEELGEGGLLITEDGDFDRELRLEMTEWGYSDMQIDVKAGERIKFTVINVGQIPHEFMFMTMPAMAAVAYRMDRADWSLLEHEALFEEALVLPGGEFTFVVEIQEAGTWMFMCMLPYHMQMGMMGQMSTPGMAMQMEM